MAPISSRPDCGTAASRSPLVIAIIDVTSRLSGEVIDRRIRAVSASPEIVTNTTTRIETQSARCGGLEGEIALCQGGGLETIDKPLKALVDGLNMNARLGHLGVADDTPIVGVGIHRFHRLVDERGDLGPHRPDHFRLERLESVEQNQEPVTRGVGLLLVQREQAHREIGKPIFEVAERLARTLSRLQHRDELRLLTEDACVLPQRPTEIEIAREQGAQQDGRQEQDANTDREARDQPARRGQRSGYSCRDRPRHQRNKVTLMALPSWPSLPPSLG